MQKALLSLMICFLMTLSSNAQETNPTNKNAQDKKTTDTKSQDKKTSDSQQKEIDKKPENTDVSEARPANSGEPETASSEGKHWAFYLTLSGIFDSNINHDEDDINDYGAVAGAGVYFRNRSERPNFEFNYEIGRHEYKNTDRWDRTSHNIRVRSENRLREKWVSDTEGEISIKGSTEDRELADRYSISQFFQYRLTRENRFNFGGAYRIKRYSDDPRRNAANPYLEGGYERRFTGNRKLEFSYRYEENRARDESRYSYIRWTYGAEFETPLFKGGRLQVEARYRPQKYARIIEIELPNGKDIEVTRRDRRWIFSADWRRIVWRDLELGLIYKYEQRNSNDEDRNFKAHAAGVIFTYRWWK